MVQVRELKLQDEWEERCQPSGGFAFSADPVQRRNGRAPITNLKQKLLDTAAQAKQLIGKEQVGLPGLSCKLVVLTEGGSGRVCDGGHGGGESRPPGRGHKDRDHHF